MHKHVAAEIGNSEKSGTPSQKGAKWASWENCIFFRDASLKNGTVPEKTGGHLILDSLKLYDDK